MLKYDLIIISQTWEWEDGPSDLALKFDCKNKQKSEKNNIHRFLRTPGKRRAVGSRNRPTPGETRMNPFQSPVNLLEHTLCSSFNLSADET